MIYHISYIIYHDILYDDMVYDLLSPPSLLPSLGPQVLQKQKAEDTKRTEKEI